MRELTKNEIEFLERDKKCTQLKQLLDFIFFPDLEVYDRIAFAIQPKIEQEKVQLRIDEACDEVIYEVLCMCSKRASELRAKRLLTTVPT